MPAIIEAFRAGLFARNQWLPNIVSGLIVGIVALPLAMAFAIAINVKPEHGIYTAIIAGFVVSAFGGTRLQIAGPTGAFIVILSGVTAKYGLSGLQIATFMAGAMLLFLGIVRMGAFIKFIPAPVIIGFTTGIAIIIWVGQWENFFGLSEFLAAAKEQRIAEALAYARENHLSEAAAITQASTEHFHEKVWHLIKALPHLSIPTTLIAISSLFLIIFGPKKIPYLKYVPGPLLALVFATIIQSIFKFQNVATIQTAFGGIPSGLPKFSLPTISLKQVSDLIAPAFTIAILGAIESLLSAVVADNMSGTRHNSNQELIGQGVANMVTPLFGGFAATGAIARTATNIRNGGTSPLSGIVHSLTLVIIIVLLAPLAANIPLAALAAILFVVAWNMSEAKRFRNVLHNAPKADMAILVVTFLLTLFADLVIAVNIGVILAMVQFLRRMAASVEVNRTLDENLALPDEIHVYAVEGPLFFGAAENFEHSLIAKYEITPKIIILHLHWVPFVDITGIQALEYVIYDLHKKDTRILLAGANHRVFNKLRRAGIIDLIHEQYVFDKLEDATAAAKELINRNHSESQAIKQIEVVQTEDVIAETSLDHEPEPQENSENKTEEKP